MASYESQSSLLLSVIRKLLDCTDDDDRFQQRRKLEEDLSVAEDRMNNHVEGHLSELHGALETFSKVDARITSAQTKVKQLKKTLLDCRTLLQCKRDDLKRLWAEDLRFKKILNELQLVEKVKGVPEELKILKANKHYLHATELLTNTVAQLDKDLAMIEALRELRVELRGHKEKLHCEIIEELHKHLYIKFTPKQESSKKVQEPPVLSTTSSPSSGRKNIQPAPVKGHSRTLSRTHALEMAAAIAEQSQSTTTDGGVKESQEYEEVIEDLSVQDPEADSSHYMAILVECLSTLNKIPEAVKEVHNRMETELLLMLERAAVQVSVNAGMTVQEIATKNQPRLLEDLLKACFDKFCNVVAAHEVLLQHLKRTKETYKLDLQIYSKKDVWAVVQHVLQQVLSEHLAFDEAANISSSSSSNALSNIGDLGSYFLPKKRPGAMQQAPLFKFDSSRHAMSISIYLKERRHAELALTGDSSGANISRSMESAASQILVCVPQMRNITNVFRIICEFVSKVEGNLNLKSGEHCVLYHFIHSFVEDTFIDAVRIEHSERIHVACKSEVIKTTVDPRSVKGLQLNKPIFQCVLVMWRALDDLHKLMRHLPKYANRFLSIACNLASQFRDECHLLYRLLTVQGGESGRRLSTITPNSIAVVSARWARDDDISRMLRSLPSWKNMHDSAGRAPFTFVPESSTGSLQQSQHQKESDLLTTNLPSEQLRSSNIILNLDTLKTIATLHESLEWLTTKMKDLTMSLTTHGVGGASVQDSPPPGGSGTMSPLTEMVPSPLEQGPMILELFDQLSKVTLGGFQTLAESAMLVLHIEVRCHCYYYMLPAVSKSSYVGEGNQTIEPEISDLIKDLMNLETHMQDVLQPAKFRYLFDGLGHLISSIFISSTAHLRKINSEGIKKMLKNITALQHCLSKITLNRESDLDHAKQYYELLYLNSDEMLRLIAEQGRVFSQQDYANAMKLIAQSQRAYDHDGLQKRLETLASQFSSDNV